jgi:hypothetical protein
MGFYMAHFGNLGKKGDFLNFYGRFSCYSQLANISHLGRLRDEIWAFTWPIMGIWEKRGLIKFLWGV